MSTTQQAQRVIPSKAGNLPHLLKLLDDESDVVREAVAAELSRFGPSLERELGRLKVPADAMQRQLIRNILSDRHRVWLRSRWSHWQQLPGDMERLETAQSLLAEFQHGRSYPETLDALLDELAEEYHATYQEADPVHLAEFLFEIKGLSGNRRNYYDPMNSNLVHVIDRREGLPISLACVYMLVGDRLGMDIKGCDVPGHFVACTRIGEDTMLVDCFHRGRLLTPDEFSWMHRVTADTLYDHMRHPPDADAIMRRVLINLQISYSRFGDVKNEAFMGELLDIMG